MPLTTLCHALEIVLNLFQILSFEKEYQTISFPLGQGEAMNAGMMGLHSCILFTQKHMTLIRELIVAGYYWYILFSISPKKTMENADAPYF